MAHDRTAPRSERNVQICFFFNAQRHQLLHGIATAVELARLPRFDVYVVSPSEAHVDYAREVARRLGDTSITFVHARSKLLDRAMNRTGSVVPPKLLSLTVLARWLNTFDAICLPERTSMILKRFGVNQPRFIHLDHGAGDRAAGFDKRIRHFDFVLMAGAKHRERLMAERLVKPGNHAVVGYPKFEAADAVRDHDWYPFAQRRPVVLYNPHFSDLGSWSICAEAVLAAFAAQDRYNLLLAPHVRLLDSTAARERWGALLARYKALGHIHIDAGTDRAIDMTYTTMADLYLGDVSSQVYEFLRRPRPCLFLNPHKVEWARDENYAHWHFGKVLPDASDLIDGIDDAFATHALFVDAQVLSFTRTFAADGGAACAARAIAGFIDHERPELPMMRPASPRKDARPKKERFAAKARRMAALVPLLACGWMLGEVLKSTASEAASEPFLDRAVASHRTTLLRQDMRSQIEVRAYNPAEISAVTGIAMPELPNGWQVDDAQLYPSTYGPLIQVYLRTPKGEPISLVAMRMDTRAGRTPLLEDRAGERVAYWEEGDSAFALVSQLPASRLLALAAELSGVSPPSHY